MAALRKSARAGEARKKALEKAAEFESRHQNLVKLSEKYFEAEGRIEDIDDELEEKIKALRKDAEREAKSLKETLRSTAQAMLDTKEPKGNVAQRLGLSGAALGKLVAPRPPRLPAVPEDQPNTENEPAAASEESESEQGGSVGVMAAH